MKDHGTLKIIIEVVAFLALAGLIAWDGMVRGFARFERKNPGVAKYMSDTDRELSKKEGR